MEQITLSLNFEDPAVSLCGFLPEGTDKPALLVLPGGGYMLCAPGEGAPVAERFAELGYAAFVLNYSIGGLKNPYAVFPSPLREVAQVVKYLREHADELGIDPSRICLFGASAGGHLAACYGNSWRDAALFGDIADAETLRPNALVLLYGATEMNAESMMMPSIYGHAAPFTAEECDCWTARLQLNENTPPAVLFHSAPDPTVPVQMSLDLFSALQSRDIASELHIFGCGEHAYGLGTGTPADIWPVLADRFLREVYTAPENFSREEMLRRKAARHGAF